jgi:ferredoxin
VLDNGRSNLIGTEYEDTLACIRCGACLNVCPVYRHVGGHAYRSVYSGPIGAVLTPLLAPDDEAAAELPYARHCAARAPTCARFASRYTICCCGCGNAPTLEAGFRSLVARMEHVDRLSTICACFSCRTSFRARATQVRLAKVWSRDRKLPRGGDR